MAAIANETGEFCVFAASTRSLPESAVRLCDVPQDEVITFSLYLRPRPDSGTGDREALHAERALLHRDDLELVRRFAATHRLRVVEEAPGRRLVRLVGDAGAVQSAFRVRLGHYRHDGHRFRGRSGPLHLPRSLTPVIESVLGLDDRPQAQPRLRRAEPGDAALSTHLPNAIGALYGFPAQADGTGQAIALIELGGGFDDGDTAAAFSGMGLKVPVVAVVGVDGATNIPSGTGADGEVALDIQVAGGNAPGAQLVAYFAPNTDQGFADALSAAVMDAAHKPSVISVSWGSPEPYWTQQAVQTMNTTLQDAGRLGISVFVASGDSLATDGVEDGRAHVDFPASSPYAIGCGGSLLTVQNGVLATETVWNDGTTGSGGGISALFPVPPFQQMVPPPRTGAGAGRGVPDVAAVAAPASGYEVVVGGQTQAMGGTSAAAPLWAALAARINQKAAKPIGFFLPRLYAAHGVTRDITQGSNRPAGSSLGYDAGPGWDPCTGLGSPDGQALFDALTAAPD